jgi:hypothetical protein
MRCANYVGSLFVAAFAEILAVGGPSMAMEFPGTCTTPSATVTQITGINTSNARMQGQYTLPDIIKACREGHVEQSDLPNNICIERYSQLTYSPPLLASADCVEGWVNVQGQQTKLPTREDCASGGTRAISAFQTLCPSYGGDIWLKD